MCLGCLFFAHGRGVYAFRKAIGDDIYVLTRFTQLELLQGAKDEYDWKRLKEYLATQYTLSVTLAACPMLEDPLGLCTL